MLSFNDILRAEGIDPAKVRLVRHQDAGRRSPTIYGTYRSPGGRRLVEEYQCVQSRRVFNVGELVASFVVTPRPRNQTLFFGLYRVDAVGKCEDGARDPIFGDDVAGMNRYDMPHDPQLEKYEGRLSIDWGLATRAWHQKAVRQPKQVRAITEREDPPFPGFARFVIDLDDVAGLYSNWQELLREVKGAFSFARARNGCMNSLRMLRPPPGNPARGFRHREPRRCSRVFTPPCVPAGTRRKGRASS